MLHGIPSGAPVALEERADQFHDALDDVQHALDESHDVRDDPANNGDDDRADDLPNVHEQVGHALDDRPHVVSKDLDGFLDHADERGQLFAKALDGRPYRIHPDLAELLDDRQDGGHDVGDQPGPCLDDGGSHGNHAGNGVAYQVEHGRRVLANLLDGWPEGIAPESGERVQHGLQGLHGALQRAEGSTALAEAVSHSR